MVRDSESLMRWITVNRLMFIVTLYSQANRFEFLLTVEDEFNYIIFMFEDIVQNIIFFFFFLVLQICMFAAYLTLFGKVQLTNAKLANLPEADLGVKYTNFVESIYFIAKMLVGAIEEGAQFEGQIYTNWGMKLLFLLITIYLIIIALNFLIALMTDIFTKNQATLAQNKLKIQLSLIIEYWTTLRFFFLRKDTLKSLKYIVAAFGSQLVTADDSNVLGELNNDLTVLGKSLDRLQKNQGVTLHTLNELRNSINRVLCISQSQAGSAMGDQAGNLRLPGRGGGHAMRGMSI